MKTRFTLKVLILVLFSIFSFSSSAIGTIRGMITYHDQFGIEDFKLYLYDISDNIVDSTITNSVGYYVFNQVPYGDYILRGTTDLISFGVGMEDAYMIEQYLLGNVTLTEFQIFAGDVDGDGEITWDDYYMITDWWLTNGIPFPIGEWKFEEIEIAYYDVQDGDDNDAKVTSTGDVDAGGIPDRLIAPDLESFTHEQIVVDNYDVFNVPIYLENETNLNSYHFSLKYNNEMLEIVDLKTNNGKGIYSAQDGILRITCTNISSSLEKHTEIATITARIKDSQKDIESVSFEMDGLPQFIDESGEMIKSAQLNIPKIKIVSESFEVIGSYPNPFINNTNIEYYLPEEGYVSVGIYNSGGQLLNILNKEFKQKGFNTYYFDGSDLPAGLYMYRIEYIDPVNQTHFTTRSMIKSN